MEKPEAYQGFYYGIRNLMEIFDKHEIKELFYDGSEVVSVSMEESEVIWCKVCGETNTPTTCTSCKKEKKNG